MTPRRSEGLVRTAAKYPIGTAVMFQGQRARIISVKWSWSSGWWFEIRMPNNVTHGVPEALIEQGVED